VAFRPLFSRDRLYAIFVLLGLAALTLLLAEQMVAARPVGPKTVIFLALLLPVFTLTLLLAWRVWQLFGLDYWLDRDALRIHWAGDLITLPLDRITAIRRGQQTDPPPDAPRPNQVAGGRIDRDGRIGERNAIPPRPNWLRWPLGWVEPRRVDSPRAIYATQAPADCLVVVMADCTYLISPADPAAFLAAFHTRRQLGPLRALPETVEPSALHEHWLRRDRVAQFLLAGSLLAGLLLLGYFLWRYPTLPDQTPLHFDARGLVDRIGPRRALMLLPSVALLIWFFNVVIGFVFYERRPLAAYLLWGNALAVQIAGLLIGRNLFQLMS